MTLKKEGEGMKEAKPQRFSQKVLWFPCSSGDPGAAGPGTAAATFGSASCSNFGSYARSPRSRKNDFCFAK